MRRYFEALERRNRNPATLPASLFLVPCLVALSALLSSLRGDLPAAQLLFIAALLAGAVLESRCRPLLHHRHLHLIVFRVTGFLVLASSVRLPGLHVPSLLLLAAYAFMACASIVPLQILPRSFIHANRELVKSWDTTWFAHPSSFRVGFMETDLVLMALLLAGLERLVIIAGPAAIACLVFWNLRELLLRRW